MIKITCVSVAALLALAGCAAIRPTPVPPVSVVNSLSFDNAVSGKRDGLRSVWPASGLARSTEHFPMGQVKRCDAGGAKCKWGVLKAHRSFSQVEVLPDGVMVDVKVAVDVDRSHSAVFGPGQTFLTIPADVGALQSRTTQTRRMKLEYGKVARIDFPLGITYEMCALRNDAAGQPLHQCNIEDLSDSTIEPDPKDVPEPDSEDDPESE